jgi:hypothetical protein
MSHMGQSRHFDRAPLTSGLPRLADNLRVILHVSKVPTTEVPASFVHLVGQRKRHRLRGDVR